jgi:hypothetical protein
MFHGVCARGLEGLEAQRDLQGILVWLGALARPAAGRAW